MDKHPTPFYVSKRCKGGKAAVAFALQCDDKIRIVRLIGARGVDGCSAAAAKDSSYSCAIECRANCIANINERTGSIDHR